MPPSCVRDGCLLTPILDFTIQNYATRLCAAREPAVGRCNRPGLLALVHYDHVGHCGRFRLDRRPPGRPARRPRSRLGTRPSPMAAPAIGPGLLAAHLPGSCRVSGAVQGAAVHRRGSAKHMRPLVGAVRPLQPPARQQRGGSHRGFRHFSMDPFPLQISIHSVRFESRRAIARRPHFDVTLRPLVRGC